MELRSATTSMEREQMNTLGHLVVRDNDWYESLVDDIKSTITEAVFTSNWALIEGYWLVGKRLQDDTEKEPLETLVKRVARDIGKSTRTLYYATKFYQRFPDLNLLPEGKNSRWYQIKHKYLTEPAENSNQMHDDALGSEKDEVDDLFSGYKQRCLNSKSGSVTFEDGGYKWKLMLVREKVPSENGAEVNELIKLFEGINPSYESLFKIAPQRQAMERMLVKHGFSEMSRLIMALPSVVGKPYAPRISTPVQLENKFGDLLIFVKQKEGQVDGRVEKIY